MGSVYQFPQIIGITEIPFHRTIQGWVIAQRGWTLHAGKFRQWHKRQRRDPQLIKVAVFNSLANTGKFAVMLFGNIRIIVCKSMHTQFIEDKIPWIRRFPLLVLPGKTGRIDYLRIVGAKVIDQRPGIGIGLVGAAAMVTLMRSLLLGSHLTDLLAFIAMPAALAGTALLACWSPARRAARVNPMEALHYE